MSQKLEVIFNQSFDEKQNRFSIISKKYIKIENLIHQQKEVEKKIETIKKLVDTKIFDDKQKLCNLQQEFIKTLQKIYLTTKLTAEQKSELIDFVFNELATLRKSECTNDEINVISDFFKKEFAKNLTASQRKLVEKNIRKTLKDFGVKIDPKTDVFEKFYSDNFQEEAFRRAKEAEEEREKAYKQKEQEKKVLNTDIDFQKLYKKLAKKIHPDLYKNEAEKEAQELLMKRLTNAWENRQYHEILLIWIEIDPENTIGLELTEKNQKNIIKQLNEKITGLEAEIYATKFFYDETAFYYENFHAPSEKGIERNIERYIFELKKQQAELNEKIKRISNTAELKKYLNFRLRAFQEEFL